ncbi:MAG: cation-translocating P-type ATPase [Bacillota bacterium]|nr:cation-translocating P-type ATPase [Candidatus Fermentithermobacillaceae bacterium]
MSCRFHSLTWQDVVRLLGSDVSTGLHGREARRRLSRWGPNKIVREGKSGWFALLWSQFADPMVATLLGATAISAFMGEVVDALVISAIVLLNALLGMVQEYKAEEALKALEVYSASSCCVLRSGVRTEILPEAVVPGDIVLLRPGVRVAADGRLVASDSLQVEESILTGEAFPVSKHSELVLPESTGLSERKNMVYSGTLVTRGTGAMVVTATGMRTEMGRIASLLQTAQSQKTPLETRLESLSKGILASCLGICVVLAVIGFVRGIPFHEMFLTAVSLAVAAIPEGLPATVTLCLAMGVQEMARKGAVVRKLEAIETLGSVTVICTDKTGTLTRNRMELVELGVLGTEGIETVSGDFTSRANRALVEHILEVAVLASDARCRLGDESTTVEDPTEQAIVRGYAGLGCDPKALDDRYPRVNVRPFTPERRMMSVMVKAPGGFLICAKGAPDTIIPLCTAQEAGGMKLKLATQQVSAWEAWIDARAERGMRILAVAKRRAQPDGNAGPYREEALVLLGCLAMADPLRPEAASSVQECTVAGIRTVLITGDHLKTAESIARETHILPRGGQGVTGEFLDTLADSALGTVIERHNVFARVSPAHKLKIVRALKNRGHVVAMTGDGINDGPALKEAAVGVAMGKSGSDIARESSSIVLLDDNFSTIVRAVEQGRTIYDNIRKFIRYMLSCNLGEVIVVGLAVILGLPMPLTPVQILMMNLVTDGLPALALSMDPPDASIMKRPPRNPGETLFSGGLSRLILKRGTYVGLASLLMFIEALRLWDLPTASTMAFATLVTVQLVSAIDCRSETHPPWEIGIFTNEYLIGACALSWLMLLATVQIPALGVFFDTVPLSGVQWLTIFLVSVMPDVFRMAYRSRSR